MSCKQGSCGGGSCGGADRPAVEAATACHDDRDWAPASEGIVENEASRREFLCALAGCAAALAGGCSEITHTPFFQKRFRELSAEERAAFVADLEREHSARFHKPVKVGLQEAKEGVLFGYALALHRLPATACTPA
jgi:hypothetical protein